MDIQIFIIILLSWTYVDCGCYQKRLCCPGRNMSCVSVESGTRNVFNPHLASRHRNRVAEAKGLATATEDVTPTDASAGQPTPARSRNWHLHVPDMKLMDDERIENFTQWLYEHNNHHVDHREETNDDELDHPKFENLNLPFFDPVDLIDQSGFYDEDAGSGNADSNANFSSVTFFDSQREITDAPEGQGVQYAVHEGAKYKILPDDKPKLAKIEFNGNTKEISYVIISDSQKDIFPQMIDEKIGFLKDDSHDCYCDEECRTLNDCCSDFVYACPSHDCEIGAWSGWGYCETGDVNEITRDQCGPGISKRVRSVIEQPGLGGIPCPHLVEHRSCYNADGDCGQLASEVALLLLYKYSSAREPGYKNNIYYDLPKTLTKLSTMTSYCSIFDVHWLNTNCQDVETKRQLRPGAKVCVECQPAAQKSSTDASSSSDRCTGHGMIGTTTLWSLIGFKSCSGQWILEKKIESCECQKDYPTYFKFIFV